MRIRLAIFDLDGTLLAGSKTVMPRLAAHLWRAGFRRPAGIPRFAMAGLAGLGRKLRLITREQYTEYGTNLILSWMAQKRPAEMAPLFRATAQELLQTARASTLSEIRQRQQEGFRTVILSATIQPFLEEIAHQVNCEAVGTPVELTAQGLLTGRLAGPFCSGPVKLTSLRAWADGLGQPIDWASSYAYGDTLPDQDVLAAVGHPVAVAPEEALRAVATGRGWRIIAE